MTCCDALESIAIHLFVVVFFNSHENEKMILHTARKQKMIFVRVERKKLKIIVKKKVNLQSTSRGDGIGWEMGHEKY